MCAQRTAGADLQRVRTAVAACGRDLASGASVLIACSGGPDSLALTAAAGWAGARLGWQVTALVVDHQLQADSGLIAERAMRACELLGVRALVVQVEVGVRGGPEAAARDARYAALQHHAHRHGISAVMLGHTREDQAETVLLRLARGSGARSLAAMAMIDGLWRRPLLELPRAVVQRAAEDALHPLGLAPWHDPHNEDPRFARVRVRRLLAELTQDLGPGVIEGLTRSASALRDDADALDAMADDASSTVTDPDGELDVVTLAALPAALRTRVIRRWLLAAGCPSEDLDRLHVLAVDGLVTDWHGQGPITVPGGCSVRRGYGRLRIDGRQSPGG